MNEKLPTRFPNKSTDYRDGYDDAQEYGPYWNFVRAFWIVLITACFITTFLIEHQARAEAEIQNETLRYELRLADQRSEWQKADYITMEGDK